MKSVVQQDFVKRFEENNLNGISLYINSSNVANFQKEWLEYRKLMKQTPIIRRLILDQHVFQQLSPQELRNLLEFVCRLSIIHPANEFIIQGEAPVPKDYLDVLYSFGFARFGLHPVFQNNIIEFYHNSNYKH